MADGKDTGDRLLLPQPEKNALQGQPDAESARNTGAQNVKTAESIRTNQSDGSLRKYAGLAEQNQSIELCYEGNVASRTQAKSERELLAQLPKEAMAEQSKTMQELESAAKTNPVAEVLFGFRQQAEGMKPGPDKERLIKLTKEQAAELLAPTASEDQGSCGVHEMPHASKVPLTGHVQYPEKEIEGIKRLTPQDLQVLAKAMEKGGPAAEASIKETSGEILRRTAESYKDTVLCGVNAVVGLLEYDRDLLFNPEKAREKAAGAGEVLGLLMYSGAVGSIRIGAYAETVRQSGDFSLPLKHIPQVLNKWYESQSPADQMAILASVTGGLHLNQSIGEVQKLKKTGEFSAFLQEAVDLLPRNPEAESRAMQLMARLVKKAEPVAEAVGTVNGNVTDVVKEAQEKGIKDHIMEMVRYFERGNKRPISAEKAAEKAKVSKQDLRRMTESELEAHGLESIQKSYDRLFFSKYPHLKDSGVVVHHALPQKLLDSHTGYAELFKAKEVNSIDYLRGIPLDAMQGGKWVHDIISAKWERFLVPGKKVTRQEVLNELRAIDNEFGRFFVPPR